MYSFAFVQMFVILCGSQSYYNSRGGPRVSEQEDGTVQASGVD